MLKNNIYNIDKEFDYTIVVKSLKNSKGRSIKQESQFPTGCHL